MKQTWPYLVIVVALFLGINGPSLFSEGMFMDGLFYSTISRNLAEGSGTFWDLHYTSTYNNHFHGHPPLAMGMESLFYRFFGDHIFVEHIYSLVMFIITNFLLAKIWVLFVKEKYKNLYWFPLLFFSIIGVVGWSVANNMLENTMTLFVLLSFYVVLKALNSVNYSFRLLLIFISGLIVFLAFLTKGIVGIFPLSSFFLVGLFTNRISFKEGIIYSLLMLIGLLSPFVYLYLFVPEAITSLTNYYEAQIVHSLANSGVVSSRFWILWSLVLQLLPVVVFTGIVLFIGRRFKSYKLAYKGDFLLLLAVGISGVLPMIISLKQRDFYIVSAYPFFALSFVFLIKEQIKILLEKLEGSTKFLKSIKLISVVLMIISSVIVAFQPGRVGRDKKMIDDIKKISQVIPKESVVIIPLDMSQNWSLRGYLARYNSVALILEFNKQGNYYLSDRKEEIEGFKEVENLTLSSYYLYRRSIK